VYRENTLNNSFYHVNITCWDNTYYNNTGYYLFIFGKDKIFPVITIERPTEAAKYVNTGEFLIRFNTTDNNLLYNFQYNITSGNNVYYSTQQNISGLSFNYSEHLNSTLWDNTSLLFSLRVCDAHTDSDIRPAKGIIANNDSLTYDFSDALIAVKGMDASAARTQLAKDRYLFEFDYASVSETKTYMIAADKRMVYLKNSPYKGHFIVDDKYWIDFEQENDVIAAEVPLSRCQKENAFGIPDPLHCYEVRVQTSDKHVRFSSIGELNCQTDTIAFELTSGKVYKKSLISGTNWFNTDALDTSTTAGMLAYFFLFLLIAGLVIISEVSRLPIMMILTGLAGFFFGFLVFTQISAIIGVVSLIMAVGYALRGLYL
jgi:hypothetical protein